MRRQQKFIFLNSKTRERLLLTKQEAIARFGMTKNGIESALAGDIVAHRGYYIIRPKEPIYADKVAAPEAPAAVVEMCWLCEGLLPPN